MQQRGDERGIWELEKDLGPLWRFIWVRAVMSAPLGSNSSCRHQTEAKGLPEEGFETKAQGPLLWGRMHAGSAEGPMLHQLIQ